jgi:tetratricopeptide (TPR) repeat protein
LIETVGGRVIWTEQYDRRLENLLDVQRNIVARVASAVGGVSGQIPRTERLRMERYLPNDLKAYDLYLLAHELEVHFDREKTLRGIELIKQALALEPEFARAWLVLGWLSWQACAAEWVEDVGLQQRTVIDAYAKAAELDPLDPLGLMESASVHAIRGDQTCARDTLERALALGKNQADLLVAASNYVAIVLGEPDRAMRLMDRGLEMLLQIPVWHNLTGLRVSYFSGDYERALGLAERAPKFLLTDLFEILSLAQLGRQDALSDRCRIFRNRHPRFDHLALGKLLPITADRTMKSYLAGIAKAGLGRDAARLRVVS